MKNILAAIMLMGATVSVDAMIVQHVETVTHQCITRNAQEIAKLSWWQKKRRFHKYQELESKINTIESNAVFIDVDKQYPLDLGFYSSDTARNAIPVELRHKNLVITYRVAVTEVVIEQFIGNDIAEWLTSTNWNLISPKVKHVPISASDYEALETKDENTLYYVFEE